MLMKVSSKKTPRIRSPALVNISLPAPGIIAREIVTDLEAALEQFKLIAEDLVEIGD
jgi:hypothetical protein